MIIMDKIILIIKEHLAQPITWLDVFYGLAVYGAYITLQVSWIFGKVIYNGYIEYRKESKIIAERNKEFKAVEKAITLAKAKSGEYVYELETCKGFEDGIRGKCINCGQIKYYH